MDYRSNTRNKSQGTKYAQYKQTDKASHISRLYLYWLEENQWISVHFQQINIYLQRFMYICICDLYFCVYRRYSWPWVSWWSIEPRILNQSINQSINQSNNQCNLRFDCIPREILEFSEENFKNNFWDIWNNNYRDNNTSNIYL